MAEGKSDWKAFGMPVEEPSENELSYWRKFAMMWVNIRNEIQRRELELKKMRETEEVLFHVLNCGPNKGGSLDPEEIEKEYYERLIYEKTSGKV